MTKPREEIRAVALERISERAEADEEPPEEPREPTSFFSLRFSQTLVSVRLGDAGGGGHYRPVREGPATTDELARVALHMVSDADKACGRYFDAAPDAVERIEDVVVSAATQGDHPNPRALGRRLCRLAEGVSAMQRRPDCDEAAAVVELLQGGATPEEAAEVLTFGSDFLEDGFEDYVQEVVQAAVASSGADDRRAPAQLTARRGSSPDPAHDEIGGH